MIITLLLASFMVLGRVLTFFESRGGVRHSCQFKSENDKYFLAIYGIGIKGKESL